MELIEANYNIGPRPLAGIRNMSLYTLRLISCSREIWTDRCAAAAANCPGVW